MKVNHKFLFEKKIKLNNSRWIQRVAKNSHSNSYGFLDLGIFPYDSDV